MRDAGQPASGSVCQRTALIMLFRRTPRRSEQSASCPMPAAATGGLAATLVARCPAALLSVSHGQRRPSLADRAG